MKFEIFGYTFSITKTPAPVPQEEQQIEISNPAEDDCGWRIDEARASLESVNSWINNCDQKAGILLSGIGIVVALLFSTDFTIDRLLALANSVREHIAQEKCLTDFPCYNALCIIVCIVTFYYFARTMYYLLKSITANLTENQKNEQDRIGNDSMLFYMAIAGKRYNLFKRDVFEVTKVSYLDELLSQVHINSSICTNKMMAYKKGLKMFKRFLITIAVMFVLFLFIEIPVA